MQSDGRSNCYSEDTDALGSNNSHCSRTGPRILDSGACVDDGGGNTPMVIHGDDDGGTNTVHSLLHCCSNPLLEQKEENSRRRSILGDNSKRHLHRPLTHNPRKQFAAPRTGRRSSKCPSQRTES